MEVSVQERSIYRFGLPTEELLDGNTRCPLCGDGMTLEPVPDVIKQTPDGGAAYVCYNPLCPYTTQPEVRDVIAALIESGRTPLMAVTIAANYTADGEEPVSADRFHITDRSSANWVLKQMANIQRQIDNTQAMINNEMTAIARRGEKLLLPLARQLAFFENAFGPEIEDWLRKELDGQKIRSVKLLHGSVGFRKDANKMVVDDEQRAILTAKLGDYHDVVRVKEEIKKTDLKTLIENDARAQELFSDCAHIEPGTDTFYIKPEIPEA